VFCFHPRVPFLLYKKLEILRIIIPLYILFSLHAVEYVNSSEETQRDFPDRLNDFSLTASKVFEESRNVSQERRFSVREKASNNEILSARTNSQARARIHEPEF